MRFLLWRGGDSTFLRPTFDGCALPSRSLAPRHAAARDDAAALASRRKLADHVGHLPTRDHRLDIFFLLLQLISITCRCNLLVSLALDLAEDADRPLQLGQQGRPGRGARPTARIHRPDRRCRLAPATCRAGCRFFAPAPLLAGMRPSGRAQPRVDRRPALDRWQGGRARMFVHVSERCMGQERAREVTHGLRAMTHVDNRWNRVAPPHF